MPDQTCESCGSNITGETQDRPHLCSIKTAKGWRQVIPTHRRQGPLYPPTVKLELGGEREREAYRRWIDAVSEHADELVVDRRTGLVIQAIFNCPVSMNVSENADFFANVHRIGYENPEGESRCPRSR